MIDVCTELLLLIRIYKMQKQVPKVELCRLFHHPLIFGIRKSRESWQPGQREDPAFWRTGNSWDHLKIGHIRR